MDEPVVHNPRTLEMLFDRSPFGSLSVPIYVISLLNVSQWDGYTKEKLSSGGCAFRLPGIPLAGILI